MNTPKVINYLESIRTAREQALETTDNKEEQLALMLALHLKRLELLEAFRVEGDNAEGYEKVKEALLESVIEMIQSL